MFIQNCCVWIYTPHGQLLQERLQHAGPAGGGRQPHILRLQVGHHHRYQEQGKEYDKQNKQKSR